VRALGDKGTGNGAARVIVFLTEGGGGGGVPVPRSLVPKRAYRRVLPLLFANDLNTYGKIPPFL
jgi:hypothetical protein